jgi:hypothetical protein
VVAGPSAGKSAAEVVVSRPYQYPVGRSTAAEAIRWPPRWVRRPFVHTRSRFQYGCTEKAGVAGTDLGQVQVAQLFAVGHRRAFESGAVYARYPVRGVARTGYVPVWVAAGAADQHIRMPVPADGDFSASRCRG